MPRFGIVFSEAALAKLRAKAKREDATVTELVHRALGLPEPPGKGGPRKGAGRPKNAAKGAGLKTRTAAIEDLMRRGLGKGRQ